MPGVTILKINNSKEAAVDTGKWVKPGAKFYNTLLSSCYFPNDKPDDPENLGPADYLREAYLIAPVDKIHHSPHGVTPYSQSGCKYPHHSIKNGELVINKAGLEAAYARAKQMGEFKREVKDHLIRHYKELGMYEDSNIAAMESIVNNSDDIDAYINENVTDISAQGISFMEKSHGNLKYDFRRAYDLKTGHALKLVYSLDGINVIGTGEGTTDWNDKNEIKERAKEVQRTIARKGNLDHRSTGQRLLAIIDRVTNQKLQQATTVGPYCPNVGSNYLELSKDQLSWLNSRGDDFKRRHFNFIKVGDIDNSPTYKSTFWPKNDIKRTQLRNGAEIIADNVGERNTAGEMLKNGRGYKLNKLKGDMVVSKGRAVEYTESVVYYMQESASTLNVGFVPKGSMRLSELNKIHIDEKLIDKYKETYRCLRHVRCKDTKEYVCDGYCWFKGDDLVCMVGSCVYRDTGESYIVSLEVLEEYKGYGLGKQLLDFAVMEMGCTKLSVNKNNAVAIKIYEDYGFKAFQTDDTMIYMSYSRPRPESYDGDMLNSYELSKVASYPAELSQWMKANLIYDKAIADWRFKSPHETFKYRRGNCHDQAAFAEYVINHMDPKRYKAQVLFFIEFNEGSDIGGNSHTLCYYRDTAENNIYWIENSWETNAGIHGPYKSLDELKADVIAIYKKDDDVNSHRFEFIAFGTKAFLNFGMSLGEYVESWELETDSNGEPKGYVVNDEIQVKESTIYIDDDLENIPLPEAAPLYDPPMNAEEVREKYGEDLYIKLSKDPAHAWRMETGIELIHREPTIGELNRICSNWLAMPDELKKKSELKCKELFGFGNLKYYRYLILEVYQMPSVNDTSGTATELMDFYRNCKTAKELLAAMEDISYGWYSDDDQKVHGTGELDDEQYFYKYYKLASPKDTVHRQCGVCWDQTELERECLRKMKFSYAIIYIEIVDGVNDPSHTFAILEGLSDGKYYWFEHSWAEYRGIHEYSKVNELIQDVINKHIAANNARADSRIRITHLVDTPKYGISCGEYMRFARTQPGIDVVDIGNELFNESASDDDGIKESLPKQADKAERNKNGVERKELYMAFIEHAKGVNNKNTFSSVFDKDIFNTTYRFVPYELRYFYRLANPMLCVLDDDLTFFSLSELRKINKDNPNRTNILIFAGTTEDLRVYNTADNSVYKATEEQVKEGKLVDKITSSFDGYLEKIIGKKIITIDENE